MSLNWKEIDLILSELNFEHGKIQEALQPEFHILYLGIYAASSLHHLFINLEQNAVRLHLGKRPARKPKKAQRFQQLLQSRLVGASINNIAHLNQDRIILFSCKKRRSEAAYEDLRLYLRLWSNNANVILYDEKNRIIDALYRRPAQKIMPKEKMPSQDFALYKKKKEVNIREWQPLSQKNATPFNDYICRSYEEKKEEKNLKKEIDNLLAVLYKRIPYLEKSIGTTKKQLIYHSEFKQFLAIGNEILTRLQDIKEGQEWLSMSDPDDTASLQAHLDTTLSPSQNAELYFQKYKKSQKILLKLQEKLKSLEKNYAEALRAKTLLLELTDTVRTEPDSTGSINSTDTRQKLFEAQKIIRHSVLSKRIESEKKIPSPSARKEVAGIRLEADKYQYLIGRNAKENDSLLRHAARGNDTWVHVRGRVGAYVFIRSNNKNSIPLDRLKLAGQLAALFSKCRHKSLVELHYTQVKNLRRIPKKTGLVSVQRDKNLNIEFDSNAARALLNTAEKGR